MMPPEVASPPSSAKPAVQAADFTRQVRLLAVGAGLLAICFAKPLWELVRFTLQSELYSHILLIPFVSLWLAWTERRSLPPASRPNRGLAVPLLGVGLLSVVGYALTAHAGARLAGPDALAWNLLSCLLLFWGLCLACLGPATVRALAFPLGFLVFALPWPTALADAFVAFLQHRSADAAEMLFDLVGTPLLRQGVDFQLPGIAIEVAAECSGVRSTLVLIITGLVAAKLFLRSPAKRVVLVLAVLPLGILRNAVRIVTIGELCVHVSPDMINSNLHHKGGPLFFLVALVPFFGLLYALRRLEVKQQLRTKEKD